MTPSDIRCPHCLTGMRPTPGAKAVRCPGCGGVVQVPAAGTTTVAARAVPVAARKAPSTPAVPTAARAAPKPASRAGEEPDDSRFGKRSKSGGRPERKEAVAGNGILVLAVVGGVGALFVVGVGVALGVMAMSRSDATASAVPAPATTPTLTRVTVNRPSFPAVPNPGGVPAPGRSGLDVVQRVKESTVYIRCDFGGGRIGMGSGFFAGRPGFVVTNAHVVGYGPKDYRKPQKIETFVASGEANQRTFTSTLYGLDADADLAVLKVDAADLPPPLPFGSAAALRETEEVLIFGYPLGEQLGLNVSVNKTTVSSLRKEKGQISVVQVAGGMHPGNSGGPVVNQSGQVIGVSVAVITGTIINFAIPSDTAADFVRDQFAAGGQVSLGDLRPAVDAPVRPPFGPRFPPIRPTPPQVQPRAAVPNVPAPGVAAPGKTETKVLGGFFDPAFRESAPEGSLLTGFEIGLGRFVNNDVVRAVRAVYRAGADDSFGTQHGTELNRVVRVKAKPGYAVGAMTLKVGLTVDGMSVTFMKVGADGRLDPADAYESDWVGGQGGGPPTKLGGDGTPVVGIAGKANARDLTGLGLVFKPAGP